VGCTLLDYGIANLDLRDQTVIGVDPGLANVISSVDADIGLLVENIAIPRQRSIIMGNHTCQVSNGELRQVISTITYSFLEKQCEAN
jgi:hypothetical protein